MKPINYVAFYFSDWLTSDDVSVMSFAEKGLYIDLLAKQAEQGYIPADPEKIVVTIKAQHRKKQVLALWPQIKKLFPAVKGQPDRLANTVMADARATALGLKKASSNGGKTGANKRWGTYKPPIKSPNGSPNGGVSYASTLLYSPLFSSLWDLWKGTGNQKKARAAWEALNPSERQANQIIEVVRMRQAKDSRWLDDPKFQGHLENFLNDNRWLEKWTPVSEGKTKAGKPRALPKFASEDDPDLQAPEREAASV